MGKKNNRNSQKNKKQSCSIKHNNNSGNDREEENLISEEKRKSTLFFIIRTITLVVSILSIFISGTHGKFLFLSALIFMVPILADYLILILTVQKTKIQFNITMTAFAINALIGLIFLFGVINFVRINDTSISFNYLNGDYIGEFNCKFGENIVYGLLLFASSSYLLEHTGLLERKVAFANMQYSFANNE